MNDGSWSDRGKGRLEVAATARSQADWAERWPAPAPWVFAWGPCWTATVEYKVHDFAAEVGFFIDGLGFESNALSADYCMVMSPDRACFLSFVPALDGEATPPGGFRFEMMVADLAKSASELIARGIEFDRGPAPYDGGPMLTAELTSPNGLPIRLWSVPS